MIRSLHSHRVKFVCKCKCNSSQQTVWGLVSELGHEISQKKLKCTSFKRIKGSNETTLGRVEISAGAQGRENLSSLQNEGRHMEAVVLLAAG